MLFLNHKHYSISLPSHYLSSLTLSLLTLSPPLLFLIPPITSHAHLFFSFRRISPSTLEFSFKIFIFFLSLFFVLHSIIPTLCALSPSFWNGYNFIVIVRCLSLCQQLTLSISISLHAFSFSLESCLLFFLFQLFELFFLLTSDKIFNVLLCS